MTPEVGNDPCDALTRRQQEVLDILSNGGVLSAAPSEGRATHMLYTDTGVMWSTQVSWKTISALLQNGHIAYGKRNGASVYVLAAPELTGPRS